MLLVIATSLSGIIVFMKNDENTRRAASHAAMTINIGHLAFHTDADDSPGLDLSHCRRVGCINSASHANLPARRAGPSLRAHTPTNMRPSSCVYACSRRNL